jgi:hypothetical protein
VSFKFDSIERSVRYGLHPNEPTIVTSYLMVSERRVESRQTTEEKRDILYRVLVTLLNTICDTYIQLHWRQHCLNCIHKPLLAIEGYSCSESDTAEVRRFK